MATIDIILRNVRVVRHDWPEPEPLEIGVRDGRIIRLAPRLPASEAREVIDGQGRLAFPGVVDAHQHWGIYRPMAADAASESRACAQGGVTTALNYLRTGQYYLNRGGPYAEFFPAALAEVAGNAYVDYGFHLAPMTREHIAELPELVRRFGVSSFKIFMFYGGHGLHGRSQDQRAFLMIPDDERYDYAHFEFVMRGVQQLRRELPELAGQLSLSLHCETAEIMNAYTALVEADGRLSGLAAYHQARPPHSEGLAVTIAAYLAHETELATINLLHLSSRKAVEAALRMARAFPAIDFRREVTIGHLLADITSAGPAGKVNPPLRPREDVEGLWEHLLRGELDWVVSDHACCQAEQKFGADREDIFVAKSGFGGAEYLLPGLVSEGRRRGLSYAQIAGLTAYQPAQRFGLASKGVLREGNDADICLVDPDASWAIRAADSASAQEYSPLEGVELTARVTDTFVRGQRVLTQGRVTGPPTGRYVARPVPHSRNNELVDGTLRAG